MANTIDNKVILVFDCLRDPRDVAQIIHLAFATNTSAILTGNSLLPTHPKVQNILHSWASKITETDINKRITHEQDYFKSMEKLQKKGFTLVGTSPRLGKNLYNSKLQKGNYAIIFGTESSGLSEKKQSVLDLMVQVPMKNNTSFFTISAIAPAIVLEILRQKKLV